jgi:uncharacterized integral membrane protein (TIGR00698 family)
MKNVHPPNHSSGNFLEPGKPFLFQKLLFPSVLLLCFWTRIDTAVALVAGITFGLALTNPFQKLTSKLSKIFLQISVIGLGFGIGIGQVINEGRHSIVYTMIGIVATLIIGNFLGKILKVNKNTSQLISFGTAICGGSAIAAMAPILKAKDEEIAVSLATVFTLNSIALVLFPFVGNMVHLSQQSFGLWAALAIHDTSSVVGAAASYGAVALAIGITVKLTRAMWIAPIAMGFAFFKKTDRKVAIPYFIFGFVAATAIRSVFPNQHIVWDGLAFGAKRLLVVTLFLIGSGLTRNALKKVGFRPMIQGVSLWVIVSITTLLIILGI